MAKKEIASLATILGNQDETAKAIVAQAQLQKTDSDWKKDQIQKLKEERNSHLATIDAACDKAKEGVTDNLVKESINLQYAISKNKVKAHYAPLIEALQVDAETVGEVGGTVIGEKVGAFVAPATKAVANTVNSFMKRSGLEALNPFRQK
jgi:hypothetical protein